PNQDAPELTAPGPVRLRRTRRDWCPRVAPPTARHRIQQGRRGAGGDLLPRERKQVHPYGKGAREECRHPVAHGLRRTAEEDENVEVTARRPIPLGERAEHDDLLDFWMFVEQATSIGVHRPPDAPFVNRFDDDTIQGSPPRWRRLVEPPAACRGP